MENNLGISYKCGLCGWLFSNVCTNYLDHECFVDFDAQKHELIADECNTLSYVEKNNAFPTNIRDDMDFDELIIEHVEQRPALYDFRMKTSERTLLKRNALWEEISKHLKGRLSANDIKVRWQYLRDAYVKVHRKITEYVPSGSESKKLLPAFKHFERMKFLNDSLQRNRTVSSVAVNNNLLSPPDSNTSQCSNEEMITNAGASISKRRKRQDENAFQKAILNILKEPDSQPQAVNPLTGIDGFLVRIGEGLKRLPYRERSRLEIQMLQLLSDAEDSL